MRLFALLAATLMASAASSMAGGPVTLSAYMTAHQVEAFANDAEARENGLARLQDLQYSGVVIEIYRGGLVVPLETLADVRDFWEDHGFTVKAGIATVPGGDIGVGDDGPLTWFNWEHPKTQEDMIRVMEDAAPLFDTIIVDDFLCTHDTSEMSEEARGDRSWGEYRRELMTEMGERLFVEPVRRENPDATVILKYPQWYDKFEQFGYDTAELWRRFDLIWVGTETRSQYAQRFGFVQPYQGFVNYRWMGSIAGGKQAGAWFDFGEAEPQDFLEQGYQTVLAGAQDIVVFNYGNIMDHAGADWLSAHLPMLQELARAVEREPVRGAMGYKPPNSKGENDIFIMDYMGMLGVPFVPTAHFPDDAPSLFLPTQAAADDDAVDKALAAAENGAHVVVTAGFLAAIGDAAGAWGVETPVALELGKASAVLTSDGAEDVEFGLNLAATELAANGAEVLLTALHGEQEVPFLLRHETGGGALFVMNTYTFTQDDYDAVGEVLLPPQRLGLLEIPREWANALRAAFNEPLGYELDAPTRITLQPMGPEGAVFHNYQKEPTAFRLRLSHDPDFDTGDVTMDARSVRWLREPVPPAP